MRCRDYVPASSIPFSPATCGRWRDVEPAPSSLCSTKPVDWVLNPVGGLFILDACQYDRTRVRTIIKLTGDRSNAAPWTPG